MKIIELFEELNEFEPKPYENKKAEIAHLEKRMNSVNHQRTILIQKLQKLEQEGIVTTNATIADKGGLELIQGGIRETQYRSYYGPKNNAEVSKIQTAVIRLAELGTKTVQRIKDLRVRGSTYCFTGFRDEKLETKIMRQGGRVVSSAINGLNYLVATDPHSNSGKMIKAKQNGAKVISKAELEDFLRD